MIGIRDQTKIQTLENAWRNCGVLNTSSTGDSVCLPISDVRNVSNINYAFAVDGIDSDEVRLGLGNFKGKNSYIDNVATMETVDPNVVKTAVGTFQNNQFRGTSTGASGEENRTNLITMFANNVDLTVNGDSSDKTNGKDIFTKLFDADQAIKAEEGADTTTLTHTHKQYIAYLDGHTTCFSKNQGGTTIGDGTVAAMEKKDNTNVFIFDDETTPDESKPTATGTGLLQTEVAFEVVDQDGTNKNILSKTINVNKIQLASRGDTQTVSVGTGTLTGIRYLRDGITFSWDGTPCTSRDILINSTATFPNNMHFRICHQITVEKDSTLTIGPGAKIGLARDKATNRVGSLLVESGATVNIESGGKILIEGPITNNGTINNSGTITIDPLADDYTGTITNNGTINNNNGGIIDNNGEIDNSNGSTMTNYSTINNKKGGKIVNNGVIANSITTVKDKTIRGTIINNGEIDNQFGGTINNKWQIQNRITDSPRIDTSDSIIKNAGTINNNVLGVISIQTTLSNELNGTINNNDNALITILDANVSAFSYVPTRGSYGILKNWTDGTINITGSSNILVKKTLENMGDIHIKESSRNTQLQSNGLNAVIQNTGGIYIYKNGVLSVINGGKLINGIQEPPEGGAIFNLKKEGRFFVGQDTIPFTDGNNDRLFGTGVEYNSNEPPTIESSPIFTAAENQTAIGTVIVTDPEEATLSYSVSGTELAISSSGVLTFVTAPDYETQETYTATVTVSDGTNSVTQDIQVNVIQE